MTRSENRSDDAHESGTNVRWGWDWKKRRWDVVVERGELGALPPSRLALHALS